MSFGGYHAAIKATVGDEGIERVRDLTGGDRTHVIEAVGHMPAYQQV